MWLSKSTIRRQTSMSWHLKFEGKCGPQPTGNSVSQVGGKEMSGKVVIEIC